MCPHFSGPPLHWRWPEDPSTLGRCCEDRRPLGKHLLGATAVPRRRLWLRARFRLRDGVCATDSGTEFTARGSMTSRCARGSETLECRPACPIFMRLLGSSVWGSGTSSHQAPEPSVTHLRPFGVGNKRRQRGLGLSTVGFLERSGGRPLHAQKLLTQTCRSGSSGRSGNLSLCPGPAPPPRLPASHVPAPPRPACCAEALAPPSGREAGLRGGRTGFQIG